MAVKFLYQCEAERVFHFSEPHFDSFCHHLGITSNLRSLTYNYAKGVNELLQRIDQIIDNASPRWSTSRLAATDRCVVRLATYELLETKVPSAVILNEAVRLAKIYGTEHSGRFVNGLLDKIKESLRATNPPSE